MKKRAITGIVFVAVLLLSVFAYNGVFLLTLFGFFGVVGTWEYYQMLLKNSSVIPHRFYGLFLSLFSYIFLVASFIYNLPSFYFWIFFPFLFVPFLTELFRKNEAPFTNLLHVIAPVLYVIVPMALFVRLGFVNGSYDYTLILSFLLMQWANDTGAYLSGYFFGKKKLFERISPNKTWEGAFGGAALTVLIGLVCWYCFKHYNVELYIGFAIIIAIVGSLGDLVQSMLKRSLNVKDSGKLMPGHGGVLDRFDGLILASPFIYAWIVFVENILN
jgi:phosphatidate cytidylyltransferase